MLKITRKKINKKVSVYDINVSGNHNFYANGLVVHNCTEIIIPINEERTAVCCLSSPNIEWFELWKDTTMIADIVYLLDNVLTWFIDNAPKELWRAVNSATKSRDIGIGGMGWHYFLMKNNIAFESGGFDSGCQWTSKIFSHMNKQGIAASQQLALERGEPEDLIGTGMRNATIFAIAPNANSSIIGNTSASIEPIKANAYVHKLRVGSHVVKNPYLQKAFEAHAFTMVFGQEWIDAQWMEVIKADGSVQGLEWMDDHQKKVFKTANEIDMMFVVEQARIRQEFICQAQSVNLFFTEGAPKRYVHKVHLYAFSKEGSGVPLKSLYYCRATKSAKMEKVDGVIVRNSLKDYASQDVENEECVACSA